MTGAAEHYMHSVAQGTFQPISVELAFSLRLTDGWPDGAAPMNHGPDCALHAAFLTRASDRYAVDLGTSIVTVDSCNRGLHFRQNFRLLQYFAQRVAVKWVTKQGA